MAVVPRVDPMHLLRECNLAGTKVVFHDDFLDLGGDRLHRHAQCRMRQAPTDPPLDIGSVWYMFHQVSSEGSYTPASAKKHGFQYIQIGWRPDIVDYLVGRSEVLPGSAGKKRRGDASLGGSQAKKLARPPIRPSVVAAIVSDTAAAGSKAVQLSFELSYSDVLARVRPVKDLDVLVRCPGRKVPNVDLILKIAEDEVKNWNRKKSEVSKAVSSKVPLFHELMEMKAIIDDENKVKKYLALLKFALDEKRIVSLPNGLKPQLEHAKKALSSFFRGDLVNFEKTHADAVEHIEAIALEAERAGVDFDETRPHPIILVPCNKNAPVNMLNAEDLLDRGSFPALVEDKLKWFESTRKECVLIQRSIQGQKVTFEVRDTVKNFSKSQWLRVVAVIADGTDWQFKGWPFANLVDLFATSKGIYFKALGVPLPVHVTQWAVSILNLAPLEFQHRFLAVRDAFWTEVEDFMLSYRSRKFANDIALDGSRAAAVRTVPPVL